MNSKAHMSFSSAVTCREFLFVTKWFDLCRWVSQRNPCRPGFSAEPAESADHRQQAGNRPSVWSCVQQNSDVHLAAIFHGFPHRRRQQTGSWRSDSVLRSTQNCSTSFAWTAWMPSLWPLDQLYTLLELALFGKNCFSWRWIWIILMYSGFFAFFRTEIHVLIGTYCLKCTLFRSITPKKSTNMRQKAKHSMKHLKHWNASQ